MHTRTDTREQNQNLRNLEHLEWPQNLEKLAVPRARIGLLITLKLMYYYKRFYRENNVGEKLTRVCVY